MASSAIVAKGLIQKKNYTSIGGCSAAAQPQREACAAFVARAARALVISFMLGFSRVTRGWQMMAYGMWWIAAAALIAAELLTGTFYLLVVGVAVACAGVVAWLGWSATSQWLTASILGVVGVTALEWWKRSRGGTPRQPALDVGQLVRVQSWGPNRTARVSYRGSTWDAELATPDTPQAETMYIAATRGSVLILAASRTTGVGG
jgi:membrane protein implicated in regulation of membrane protease activity